MINKEQLIENYAERKNIIKKEAKQDIELIIELIKDGICDGGIDIYGFAKFEIKDVAERTRKYTMGELKGQEYTTPAHKTLKITPKKALKDLV